MCQIHKFSIPIFVFDFAWLGEQEGIAFQGILTKLVHASNSYFSNSHFCFQFCLDRVAKGERFSWNSNKACVKFIFFAFQFFFSILTENMHYTVVNQTLIS